MINKQTSKQTKRVSFEKAVRYYLTKTELRVLKLVGLGFTSKAIAQKLGNKLATIQAHRRNIKKKLGLRGHGSLERWCREHAEGLYGIDLDDMAK